MITGKLNPLGKLNFPSFQELLDFTSTGSESSVSVAVDSDTDKEYIIRVRNLDGTNTVNMLLGGDTSTYGFQRIINSAGTISCDRDTSEATIIMCPVLGISEASLVTASGFIKSMNISRTVYTSGTTIGSHSVLGYSYDGTASFSSLDFSSSSGNFTAGTRIYVGVRRSNV